MTFKAEKKLGANHITNEKGDTVATAVDEQTAALIARACNRDHAFDDLVKALGGLVEWLEQNEPTHSDLEFSRAALAKAKGK